MNSPTQDPKHPDVALFEEGEALPRLATCEHIAGSRKLIDKAIQIQTEMGPVFDITCDCEDGAPAGQEYEHARMVANRIASTDNSFLRMGARVHDPSSVFWKMDMDVLVGDAGANIAYLTLPKCQSVSDALTMIEYLRTRETAAGLQRKIPVHILIETHGALRDVQQIAALESVETLDFGLMDFVSSHHGALGFDVMRSPRQFEHPLLVRAKSDIVAAAFANGVVPSHNVSLTLRDSQATYADAYRARNDFGFLRMWSVHPAQIQPIVHAMLPTAEDIATASDILLAAHAADWGPIRHEETLHDRATYRYFWNVLRTAHSANRPMARPAMDMFFRSGR